jgi:hypothetical protein
LVGGVPERKSAYRLDFWRPAERNAFLDDECEHTVVEPVKTKSPSERRPFLAPQIGGDFWNPQISAVLRPSGLQRCESWGKVTEAIAPLNVCLAFLDASRGEACSTEGAATRQSS